MSDGPEGDEPAAPDIDGSRRVFRTIAQAPGVHVREIVRRSGLAYGSVEYHLRRLEQAGLVESKEEGQLRVFFAKAFPKDERPVAAAARSAPARRILAALLSLGELTHGDLAKAAQLKPSNVTYHVKGLVRRQIVAERRDGRALFLALKDRALVERVLIGYGPSFADPAFDAYLALWSEWRRPEKAAGGRPDGGPGGAP